MEKILRSLYDHHNFLSEPEHVRNAYDDIVKLYHAYNGAVPKGKLPQYPRKTWVIDSVNPAKRCPYDKLESRAAGKYFCPARE